MLDSSAGGRNQDGSRDSPKNPSCKLGISMWDTEWLDGFITENATNQWMIWGVPLFQETL